jgi:cytochrome c peroxidase
MFAAAFPRRSGPISFAQVAIALASFERTLVSRASLYDRGRLSAEAKAGQAQFRRHCASCHSGPDFTDQAYHRLDPIDPTAQDQGLTEITHRPTDRQRFRTPSLRNVSVTDPYWHDGSAPTIFAAVTRHGLAIPMDAIPRIETFLRSLTDQGFLGDPRFSLPQSACGKAL